MAEEWGNELPPKEALWTAREWLSDIELSNEHFAMFESHVGNLWRTESGFVAAKLLVTDDCQDLCFAASGGAYTGLWQAWMDLAGLETGASLEEQQSAAERALARLEEEGVSEQWRRATRVVRDVVRRQPRRIRCRLDYVLCRFTRSPVPSAFDSFRRPAIRLLDAHFMLRPVKNISG